MVLWKCTKCGNVSYSAWERSDRLTIKCPVCKAEIENPYYQGQRGGVRSLTSANEGVRENQRLFAYKCRSNCPFSLCDVYPVKRKICQTLLEGSKLTDYVKKLEVVVQAAQAFLGTIDLAERTGAKVYMPPVQWRALYKLREALDGRE